MDSLLRLESAFGEELRVIRTALREMEQQVSMHWSSLFDRAAATARLNKARALLLALPHQQQQTDGDVWYSCLTRALRDSELLSPTSNKSASGLTTTAFSNQRRARGRDEHKYAFLFLPRTSGPMPVPKSDDEMLADLQFATELVDRLAERRRAWLAAERARLEEEKEKEDRARMPPPSVGTKKRSFSSVK